MSLFSLSIVADVVASLKTYPGMEEESLEQSIYEALPSHLDDFHVCMFHVKAEHLGQSDCEDGEYRDEWNLALTLWGKKQSSVDYSPSKKREMEAVLLKGIFSRLENCLQSALTFLPQFDGCVFSEPTQMPKVQLQLQTARETLYLAKS